MLFKKAEISLHSVTELTPQLGALGIMLRI